MTFKSDPVLAVIGLGYVGLPLAIEFGKKLNTIGFDINEERISQLRNGEDITLETTEDELASAEKLSFTSNMEDIKEADVYIVAVPTPIDHCKQPNLTPLIKASELVGKVISKDNIVIYESTVYPGATEDDCIPVVERISNLKFNDDFYAGYSPERINPGDKNHRIHNITKVTSGSTDQAADYIDALYGRIIEAGTYKASSIKVAEAAKVIENTQRDLNIALMNELSIIFNKLNIDTEEVLKAAGTKWNFLPFRPGLVGGHCIGVDPYYLTHKAQEIGYHPEVILAGRRINDGMAEYVVSQVVKLMLKRQLPIANANILIMGLSFKENCPDIRNTRVIDIINEFKDYGANIDIYDPWVDPEEAKLEYGVDLINTPEQGKYNGIVLAVAHEQYQEMGSDAIRKLGCDNAVLYDIKYVLAENESDGRL